MRLRSLQKLSFEFSVQLSDVLGQGVALVEV
jgi:hypothetical protein